MGPSARAGRYVRQMEEYRAFIPSDLPPEPPIETDTELLGLLSSAERSLGRLDGAASILPNPDLFVAMYVRQEAVLSSQIEGTQSTLQDILEFEIGADGEERPKDVREVVNYVAAMEYGLKRMEELPLSLRLIREIHGKLLEGVRGGHHTPGEFRRSQNWIGPAGCTLNEATFVPPPVHEMKRALDNLEKFLHDDTLPPLMQCGIAHAQFETIHPFLDGNGRVGRLLITFLLCRKQVLRRPLLYLSHFLKARRAEYYDCLMTVRDDGGWERWMKFFLRGVAEVAAQAAETTRRILDLREECRRKLGHNSKALKLLANLFEQPMTTAKRVGKQLGCSAATANSLLATLCDVGILTETTGKKRYRRFKFALYLELFLSQPELPEERTDG